jgi:hypothetical protein
VAIEVAGRKQLKLKELTKRAIRLKVIFEIVVLKKITQAQGEAFNYSAALGSLFGLVVRISTIFVEACRGMPEKPSSGDFYRKLHVISELAC